MSRHDGLPKDPGREASKPPYKGINLLRGSITAMPGSTLYEPKQVVWKARRFTSEVVEKLADEGVPAIRVLDGIAFAVMEVGALLPFSVRTQEVDIVPMPPPRLSLQGWDLEREPGVFSVVGNGKNLPDPGCVYHLVAADGGRRSGPHQPVPGLCHLADLGFTGGKGKEPAEWIGRKACVVGDDVGEQSHRGFLCNYLCH